MNSKFFPSSLISSLSQILNWFLSILYFLLFLIILFSLISFNATDTSFIATSSQEPNNYLGSFGAYLSSFIIYCFGSQGSMILIFFLAATVHQLKKQSLNFIFLRFFGFLISIILIEQFLIINNYNAPIFGLEYSFGVLGTSISKFKINPYIGFLFLFLGLLSMSICINLLNFFKSFSFISITKRKLTIHNKEILFLLEKLKKNLTIRQ